MDIQEWKQEQNHGATRGHKKNIESGNIIERIPSLSYEIGFSLLCLCVGCPHDFVSVVSALSCSQLVVTFLHISVVDLFFWKRFAVPGDKIRYKS